MTIADGATVEGWSPDGRVIAVPVHVDEGSTGVALVDVARGTFEPIVHEASYQYAFGFSPDGRWLGVKSGRGSFADTLVVSVDGSERRTLVTDGRTFDVPSFALGGRALVFHQQSGPTTYDGDIAVVDIEGGRVRTLVGGPSNDVEPRVSPDGESVAFSRSPVPTISAALERLGEETAPSADLYVVPLEGGDPRLVATGVWPGATWSPDGTRLVALTPDLRTMLILPVDGSSEPMQADLPHTLGSMSWQPLGP
jgi:Tol biopolymer transport system component